MQIKPQFTLEKVRHDIAQDVHLVLGLTAPKSDWEAKRPPLCIIPVLDISGSMSGPKLDYAKQSIRKLIEHLSADDYFGIVSFSSSARVDAEPRRMTSEAKAAMTTLVNNFRVEGSTNFSGGMLLGLQTANKMDLPEATIVRVIMFTDGQPTHGITAGPQLNELLEKQAGRASVSAFGYGTDANQELLQGLSAKGKGNYAFVRDPDAALAAFGKELGGLLSTYAQDIRVEVIPNHGHQVKEVLTDADVEEEPTGEVEVKLPHLLSEETAHVVLAMSLAAQKHPGPRQVNAVDVKVRYQIVDADGKLIEKTEEVKAKIQFVKAGEEQQKPTSEIDEIVARAQIVKAQIEAESAAQRGDFKAAGQAFASLNLNDRGHVGVAAVANHVGVMYASADSYRATGGRRMGIRRAMTRGTTASHMDQSDQEVLLQANYSVSNSAQDSMTSAFTSGSPAPAAPAPNVEAFFGAASAGSGGPLAGSSSAGNSILIGQAAQMTGWSGLNIPSNNSQPPVKAPEEKKSEAEADSKKVAKKRSKRW